MQIVTSDELGLILQEQLDRTLVRERVPLGDSARKHVGGLLLSAAQQGERLARTLTEPLAPRFAEAMVSSRTGLLQEVGDSALLVRGVWWQYAERPHAHGVAASYYEDIGQRAYLLIRKPYFDELADKFSPLARSLALMWSESAVRDERELIALYRFWLHTRSSYARTILERHSFPLSSRRAS